MEQAFPAVCVAFKEREIAETKAKELQKEQAKALARRQRQEQKGTSFVVDI